MASFGPALLEFSRWATKKKTLTFHWILVAKNWDLYTVRVYEIIPYITGLDFIPKNYTKQPFWALFYVAQVMLLKLLGLIVYTLSLFRGPWHLLGSNRVPADSEGKGSERTKNASQKFPNWGQKPRKKNSNLVGGFNPFEKYARQLGSFPQRFGLKIKNLWNHHQAILIPWNPTCLKTGFP